MGSGPDCANHLLWLGGGEDELHVLGWFFNNLEECVEALGGDHVGLVQDENLVAVSSWSKHCSFAKLPGVINTVMRCRVNLNNIQRTRSTAA